MTHAKRWSVDIFIDEHESQTRAEARLHTGDDTDIRGHGTARLSPSDRNIPEIGDELAAARTFGACAPVAPCGCRGYRGRDP